MCNKFFSLFVSCFLLSACGGGGGGSSGPDTSATALTGSFVDSPVTGLYYETPTHSGLTNDQGEFKYLAGEIITFKMGGITLGSVKGASLITPFSLLGINPITKESTIVAELSSATVNSYDQAINIATLLQTFDVDGDPDNGINLGNANSTLKNSRINLLVKARSFAFQSDLESAKAKASISSSRQFGEAIQHLYQSLGLTVESKLVSLFVSDANSPNNNSISYEYDEIGQLTTENIDRNNDGIVDSIKSYQYDENGNVTHAIDTALNSRKIMTYDSNNQLLSRLRETIENEPVLLESYTYENNRLMRYQLDQQADGNIESTTTYAYDGSGNLTHYETDKDGDGAPESNSSYSYENNVVTSFVEDKDNDGIPNIIVVYSYDSRGNRISHNIDMTNDNRPKTLSTFEYDTNNNVSRYELDRDLDGIADYIEAYKYDQNNNKTHYLRDLNADGTWDFIAIYVYDVNGNRVRMIEDSDADGLADKTWEGSYQAAIVENSWDNILKQL